MFNVISNVMFLFDNHHKTTTFALAVDLSIDEYCEYGSLKTNKKCLKMYQN